MSNDDAIRDRRRVVLEESASDLRKKSIVLRSLGAEISYAAARLEETADLAMRSAQVGTVYGDWEGSISAAEEANRVTDGLLEQMGGDWRIWQPAVSTSGSALMYNTYSLVSPSHVRPIAVSASDEGFAPEIAQVRLAYNDYFDRQHIRDEVIGLMRSYRFHETDHGNKAISKFANAWDMYDQSPLVTDPALGTLISLRESMRLTLDELRRRKPAQRRSGNEIVDIGDQLAASHLPPGTFQGISDDWAELEDDLSRGKDLVLPRDEERRLLQRGTYLIHRLLSAVDGAKLKAVR